MNEDGVVATVGPGPGGTGTTSVRSYRFFLDGTIAATGLYATNGPFAFDDADGTNFVSNVIELHNDTTNHDMWFSFDGVNDHGRVAKTEDSQQLFRHEKAIWIRGTTGDKFRLSAW